MLQTRNLVAGIYVIAEHTEHEYQSEHLYGIANALTQQLDVIDAALSAKGASA